MRDDEFYTHASDQDKQGNRLSFRLPADADYALSKIVQSGRFPNYGTKSDIIRDAVQHRLDWLEKQTGGLISTEIARLRAFKVILDEEERSAQFQENLSQLSKQVDRLLGHGTPHARAHAITLVRSILDGVKAMKGYWHDWGMNELKLRFGSLLKLDWDIEEE